MITAKILADSINSVTEDRLTTFLVTYPRFIHSEFMTHRMLSKNSASTRAIPTKKIIQSIIDNPAMPVFWGKNQAGMKAIEELNLEDIEECKSRWLDARDECIFYSKALTESFGLHKQIAGRILEPWFNITVLVSGTEWENFFALRAHKDAQPEIAALAELMLEEYNKSIPKILSPVVKVTACLNLKIEDYGLNEVVRDQQDWHAPYSDQMYDGIDKLGALKVSIARAARTSYNSFDGEMNVEKDFAIYDKLLSSAPLHASPAEHVAFPISESKFIGNFKGFYQFRKLLSNETQTDSRVIKRKICNGVVV